MCIPVCSSADSPVLWLRVDADMNLLRQVTWEQPDYMWQYQLKFERDVSAQIQVLLQQNPKTRRLFTQHVDLKICNLGLTDVHGEGDLS